jgi:GR25 family glycosyltransferase involved in LPS biosynthesis
MINFATMPKYCINLVRRTDRRAHAEQEFKRLGLEVEFVDGVDALADNSRPEWATALSHLSIIKRAQSEYIFITEDDVLFRDGFFEKMAYVENSGVEFDVFYVGGWCQAEDDVEQIDEHLYLVKRMAGTHAYILRNTVYEFVVSAITPDYGIDQFMTLQVLANFKGVAYLPMMATAIDSYSDAQLRMTDYNQSFKLFNP